MSFSYSGDPTSSDLDECRFLLGDTDSENPILQDEEIAYLISDAGSNKNLLMCKLFTQASVVFAKAIKRSLGPQSEDPTSRLNFFKEQARMYQTKISASGISVPKFAGPKVFYKGIHSNPPCRGGDRYV